METAKQATNVICSLHPSRVIEKIDPNPLSTKNIYCLECIVLSKDANTLYSSLPNPTEFLATAASSYAKEKTKVNFTHEPPREYLDILLRKAESMDRLTKHIKQEKRQVEDFFNEIIRFFTEMMNQKKNEYLTSLEEQTANLDAIFLSFEKELRRGYPRKEDLEFLFPSKEELNRRLAKMTTATQLDNFVRSIKEDLSPENLNVILSNQSEEIKNEHFDTHIKNLKEKEVLLPEFEGIDTKLQPIKNELKTYMNRTLESSLIIKDFIKSNLFSFHSLIINPEELLVLKEWIPNKYTFAPKLLYRGTRDGMNPQAFHSRCDGKGPTITLIKCQYDGSSTTSVIGGFLENSWHKQNKWIYSNDAFVFSITKKIKCNLIKPKEAAYGMAEYGPVFGGDIYVESHYKQFSSCPSSYENSANMIQSTSYKGTGRINFSVQEIEVFALY